MTTQTAGRAASLGWGEIGVLLIGRLAFNTAFRLVYPLLAFLATGLGVSLSTASLLVTVQVVAALLSPLGGALSDARGERFTMLAGLGAYCAGALACALAEGFGLFLAGYSLIGLGTALFMPATHSYASERSSYATRGRVLGLLELSWALAALVGVAGLSLLTEARGDWSAAYWALLGLGLGTLALIFTLDDGGERGGQGGKERGRQGDKERGRGEGGGTWAALRQPGVAAALGFVFCQLLAVELIFVVYAAWLQDDFGASTQQLGQIFALLGLVELAGSAGATLLTDRIGKRRAVLAGFGATALLISLLPLTAGSWGAFLALFLLFDLCFEFAIVSVFPLVSGLTQRGRGAVIAASVAAVGMGRIVGSLLGPRLYSGDGLLVNALTAAGVAAAGVLLGALLVREGGH